MARTVGAYTLGVLTCAALRLWSTTVQAHPLCYFDLRPPDFETTNPFCGPQQDGVCCNSVEEAAIETEYNLLSLSPACAPLYKEVLCARCDSYSAHLYELFGETLPYPDGLTMKGDFCSSLVSACSGDITFPTYDGGSTSYCQQHTGGGDDLFWSYPYEAPPPTPPGLLIPYFDDDQYLGKDEPYAASGDLPYDTLAMEMSPDGSEWWIGGQTGDLVAVPTTNLGSSSLVMDLGANPDFGLGFEEGLLHFAFGPQFGIGGNVRFYVSYTAAVSGDAVNRLSRFDYSSGNPAGTLASEEVLLNSSPRSTTIHAGGWCGFKPSAYGSGDGSHELYWSAGDSGPQTDTENHGQNTGDLHSTVVRILVPTSGTGYTIPSGNVAGGGALPEICAYGLRNPFKCSFDTANDDLWCGDVGHTKVESIYKIECNKNYGWGKFEGSRCQDAREDIHGPCDGTDRSGYEFPLAEFCHPGYFANTPAELALTGGVDICGNRGVLMNGVIGGFVYRGTFFSEVLGGAYVFGDTGPQNKLYYLKEIDGEWRPGTISQGVNVIAFAQDNQGELYVLTRTNAGSGNFDWRIYELPCGDLCETTCLEQSLVLPEFTSLGCVVDVVSDRALTLAGSTCAAGEQAMSPSICASWCNTFGAKYAGVQFGFECFCGTATDIYDKHGAGTECITLCKGVPDFQCGGTSFMEVFEILESAPTPEPTPAPGSTPAPVAPSDSTPLGCYADVTSARIMGQISLNDAGMTTALCETHCAALDAALFGTQFGTECFCGDAGTDYEQYGVSEACTMACGGAPQEICGGVNAMNVFQYTTPPPEPTPAPVTPEPIGGGATSLGCWGDSQAGRIMGSVVLTDPALTTALCETTCSGLGSAFYGTQYAIECFCGDESTDYEQYGTSTACTMTCAGAPEEICGGFFAMSVYQFGTSNTPSPTPMTTPAPVGGDLTALGCWTDSQAGRIFGPIALSDPDMTSAVCQDHCGDSPVFGTQYSTQCFCGDASSDYEQYGASTACTMACGGASEEICGGSNAMSVYSNGGGAGPTPAPIGGEGGVTELGCFVDVKNERIMVLGEASSSMTTATCEAFCAGSAYFGTQWGQECWCGDANTDYDQHGVSGGCTFDCAGDANDKCGGYNAMSVYAYGSA